VCWCNPMSEVATHFQPTKMNFLKMKMPTDQTPRQLNNLLHKLSRLAWVIGFVFLKRLEVKY
jgi:hypothetical protein